MAPCHGLIGFGEAYQTGAWDADDLSAVLGAFARRIADVVPRRCVHLSLAVGDSHTVDRHQGGLRDEGALALQGVAR